MEYKPKEIEQKWQRIWQQKKLHYTPIISNKPKYYCLDMFPYPSGSGLHVGHWRGYVLSDVWARYKKLQGYNVLHPMGWDAFGLPAENDAIKKGIHPKINTKINIDNMKRQLEKIGAMYDWEKEINTSSPEYYKWTQWIFLQMYKKGLAYRKEMPINWCPNCKTGLANEEVINGRCERCDTLTTKKELMQWMLKITAYADRLLNDLDKLNWPEKVKLMQKNWIGKSEGANITFKVIAYDGKEYDLVVFTTRPDTLFGATYVMLAPEHPLINNILEPARRNEALDYIKVAKQKTEVQRTDLAKEKTGVFTGSYAINPVNGQKIPIWIGDYVLIHYGSGAIMCVPAHDERDFEFACKYNLPIVEVVFSKNAKRKEDGKLKEAYIDEGVLINSGIFNGINSEEAKEKIVLYLKERGLAEKATAYKLRDWIFSRQRYWGEPIPIIYCNNCGEVPVPEEDLPVLLPEVDSYRPTGTGKSPLANIPEFVNTQCPKCNGPAQRETDTMPQWAGSCWYFLRYPNPNLENAPFDKEIINKWLPVDCYVGGIEHAVLHLLYARFFTKVLYDLGYINFDEPFIRLFNQGMVCKYSSKTGRLEKMSKSKGNVVNPDPLVKKYGADTVRLYELFMGPSEQDVEWQDEGIEGMYRFLQRLWRFINENKENLKKKDSPQLLSQLNILIYKITTRLESFKFNTAISAFMEFLNYINKLDLNKLEVSKNFLEKLIILLAPFAPHISEELWESIGNKESVFLSEWPKYDEKLLSLELIELPVQVNGKLRATMKIEPDAQEEDVIQKAVSLDTVKRYIEGKQIKRTIYVKNKIINFVVG